MANNISEVRSDILYYGINGYGITYTYFMIHIVLLGIGGMGILLNKMVINSLQNRSDLTVDVSKIFIINLARSDIINSCICLYSVIYNLVHFKHYYECALRIGLLTGINLSSALYLLSLTFDRFFKIMYPYKYCSLFKESGARVFSASACIFCASMGLLPLMGWRKTMLRVDYCSFFGVISESYLVLTFTLIMSMFAVMMFCYVSIVNVAFIQSRKIAQLHSFPTSANTKALWWKPTKTVLILTVFYFICWSPLGICVSMHLFDGFPDYYTDDNKGTVLAYCSFLLNLNFIGNPIIYILKIRAVNKRAKNFVSTFRRRDSKANVNISIIRDTC